MTDQIARLLEFVCNGKAEYPSARAKLEELEERRKTLEAVLAVPARGRSRKAVSPAAVRAKVEEVRGAIARLTAEERRELLDALGIVIRVRPDKTAELTAEPGGLLDPVLELGAADGGQRFMGLWCRGRDSNPHDREITAF